jgi:hypothetical protein
MSNTEAILKNFRDVSLNAKDSTKQMFVAAVRSKKLTLSDAQLALVFQIIDAGIDNAWGNSEKMMKNVIAKAITEPAATTPATKAPANPKKK